MNHFCVHSYKWPDYCARSTQKKTLNSEQVNWNDLQHANYLNYVDYYLRHISVFSIQRTKSKMFTETVFIFFSLFSVSFLFVPDFSHRTKTKPKKLQHTNTNGTKTNLQHWMYRMADKCTGILKKQPEPKINDGEHKSSVTTDSTASTEVKTAINVDDKNAHNAKSMLSSVGAAEFKSSKVALVSRTTAYTPFNDITITRTANTTSIPILKTVWNKLQRSAIWFLLYCCIPK